MLSANLKLSDKKIESEIENFLSSTQRKHWDDLIRNIENANGIFYKKFLYIRNPLAKYISHYNTLQKKGKSIWKNINEDIYSLSSIAYTFNFLYKNLNQNAKTVLLGNMRSDDIRSFLFELEVIECFFRSEAQIDFIDYENKIENGQTYDFLINMNNREFEVECKYKEYDSKRKLTRPTMYLLTDSIMKEINFQEFNCIVSFEFKDSLTKNYYGQKEIIEILKNKLSSNIWEKTEYKDFYLEIIPISFNMVLDTSEKVRDTIKPYYLPNNHFFSLCTDKNNFFIRYQSLKKDELADGIYESLKKTPTQFSQKRAGIIFCHIEGIYSEDWTHLKDKGDLYNMTKYFLFKNEYNFIHSVIYSSKPEPKLNENLSHCKKHILTFKNPHTNYYNEYDTKDLMNILNLD